MPPEEVELVLLEVLLPEELDPPPEVLLEEVELPPEEVEPVLLEVLEEVELVLLEELLAHPSSMMPSQSLSLLSPHASLREGLMAASLSLQSAPAQEPSLSASISPACTHGGS